MKIVLSLMVLSLYVHSASILLPDNFKADFIETVTNTKKKTIQYSGNINFSNKTETKWSFLKPTKKETCTKQKNLIVVDHDLEQVSYYKITNEFDLIDVLKKAKLHTKNIYVAKVNGKNITIKVDSQGKIESVALFDDLDNKVQIVFKNVKYGKGNLSTKSMSCNVPKNYDIING